MSKNLSLSLSDLSFSYPKHTIKVGDYLIPIHIHIKNIYPPKQSEELKIGLIGIEDEMSFEYERVKLLDRFKEIIQHINTEDKLYSNFTKNFLEYHELESLYDLFFRLGEYEILQIVHHINKILPSMISIFRERLYKSLKLDIKQPNITYKSPYELTPDLKEYLNYTEFYILCQAVIEFNPTPIFEENKNKSISEWSLREYEVHMSYLTAKNRFEDTLNKYQGKQMEDARNKN